MRTYADRKTLNEVLEKHGFHYCTYSPGDGVTRYRFFRLIGGKRKNDYFGPASGLFTALGWKEAEAYANGLIDATTEDKPFL